MSIHRLFADWHKVAKLETNAADLEKRSPAIKAFINDAGVPESLEVVRLFFGLRSKDSAIVENFRNRFKEVDEAFSMRGNDPEIRVLAGTTIAVLLDQESSEVTDATALAVVSAYIHGQRTEVLLPDIVDYARDYLRAEAVRMHMLSEVPEIAPVKFALKEPLTALKTAIETATWSTDKDPLVQPFNQITSAVTQLTKSISGVREAVIRNQSIFREESNMLWWLTGEYSRDLEQHVRDVGHPGVCAIIGKELADITDIMPGPRAARSFLQRMLFATGIKLTSSVKLIDVVNSIPQVWKSNLTGATSSSLDDLCPLHSALRKSAEMEGVTAWIAAFESSSGLKARKTFAPLDIASQMYEEVLLMKIVEPEGVKANG